MGEPLLLVEAAGSYRSGSEDRLTEIMATALNAHDGFSRLLLKDLEVDGWRHVEVNTQQGFGGESRLVDIVIYCFDSGGRPSATVFIENKLEGYWFSEGQAQRQRVALEATKHQGGKRVLAGITEDSDLARSDSAQYGRFAFKPGLHYDRVLVWSEVEALARQAGEGYQAPWGGADWQRRALNPETPACQRLLYEFITYLGGEALAALDKDTVLALKWWESAEDRVVNLLELTVGANGDFTPLEKKPDDLVIEGETMTGRLCWVVSFEPSQRHWLTSRTDGQLDLLIALSEYDDDRPVREPHIYAGISFAVDRDERRAIENASEWKASLEAQGFRMYPDRGVVSVYRGTPLNWIIQQGSTVNDQAGALATWTAETFSAAQLLPSPLEI